MDECVYVQRCVSVDDYLTSPIPQLDHVTCPLSDVSIRRVSPVCNFDPAHKTCSPRFLNVNRFIRTLTTKVTRVHITISGAFSRISIFLTTPT